ncbi:MAG TPA: isoprenylcysteine carboxylmethyltransferase family protein, partial [Coriobacteriia bacterium]|nr:isoprenylcysteine carboxylmethyltransferase family protein [Coriobacteriia bacterium]
PAFPPLIATLATWKGGALMLIGAALCIGGLMALGSPNLTALPYPKDTAELRESGPYAIVRHPIYSGLIFGAFGWALYLEAPLTLLFAVALFVLFDLKSRREERWLTERFPQYVDYCRRVKRLIPWLY